MVSSGLWRYGTNSLIINKEVGLGGDEWDRIGRSIIMGISFEECPISNKPLYASKLSEERVFLTVDERDDLAGGTTDLAQGTGSVGESRTGGGSDLGQTLRSLGGSRGGSLSGLGGSLRGGRSVSDGGSPGQELRLPQNGTGSGGHFCGVEERSGKEEESERHPKQSLI
jgi:hypothetical protein